MFLWLNFGTVFLLIPPITTASNQIKTPLIYINNIFMENFSIENHTIQTESVRDPWECFRHCAKHCDCIAFQVSGKICELLDTDIDGAIGKRVKRPGTVLYHVQQNGVRVSLCSCRVVFNKISKTFSKLENIDDQVKIDWKSIYHDSWRG